MTGAGGRRMRLKAQALRTRLEGDIPPPAAHNRLLIDMTATHRFRGHTGVQRVVREIARACVESGEALPVYLEAGRLYGHFQARQFARRG